MSRVSKIKRRIWAIDEGVKQRKTDYVVVEEPLEIQIQAGQQIKSVAVTMRTPGEDYELAAGFLYNEGIIDHKALIHQITYCVGADKNQQQYNQLIVRLRTQQLPELPHLERHFIMNSACGLCGKASLDALVARDPAPIPTGPMIDQDLIYTLPHSLREQQRLFDHTGGLHAAALFNATGQLIAVREDVGRHNALDKLIGWALLNQQLPLHNHIILVSGRASFELIQKCLFAGAPILCAVSAPSSLAISLAERFDITLIGFLRDHRYNIYTGEGRISLNKARNTNLNSDRVSNTLIAK